MKFPWKKTEPSSRELADLDGASQSEGIPTEADQDEDYQPITSKEEADFRLLLAKCDLAMADAHRFNEQLTRSLSLLDGVWI